MTKNTSHSTIAAGEAKASKSNGKNCRSKGG